MITPTERKRLRELCNGQSSKIQTYFQTYEDLSTAVPQLLDLVEELEGIEHSLREQLAEALAAFPGKECPPHSWDASGERCIHCGDKDWMT